ncbi:protein MEI2-like 2 [Phoenix dactylifera]|uniref:Protein MEI2-like 2 n=1 Tax=Phoenix dactylifera TaxID=42345 RepID=A0A8B7BKG1_PHODC|nr:protein MEI2-like 2 [Phoenix dactylifera]
MEQSSGGLKPTGPSNIYPVKNAQKIRSSAWGIPSGSNAYHGSSDASLFSSSLPVLRHEKLMEEASSQMNNLSKKIDGKDSVDDLDLHGIGSLLPDDEEELLAGIMDDFDLSGLPSHVEELEEYDLFGSGGGIELDSDPTEGLTIGMAKASIADGYTGNGISQYSLPNGVGTVAGEHPYGEHPSRTLFVRNINSNVEDSELRSLFEQYGDIRTLYTACKHRGFVMISYFDIRAARTAMRALQNKPLRRRKLDIHFSIPKDNPSDKDMNQGTLVIFNLDASVSNDELRQRFGAYGEVKEIRETPHKRHHKFIEFYDVRAAEAALRALNKSDIAGKRIKLEPSRPGGARRSLMQQLTYELEHDESRIYRHYVGSPITSSPPGTWAQYGSPGDNNPLQALSRSPTGGAMSPMGSNHLPGLASVLPPVMSNSVKIPPIGKDQNRDNHAEQVLFNSNSSQGVAFQHSRSFPEHSGVVSSSPGTLNSFGLSTSHASGIGTLSGPQFLWGSPTPYSEHSQSSAWQSPSMGQSFTSNGHAQGHGFLYSNHNGSFLGSSHPYDHHHVGSAPSGLPFERHFGFFPESPDASFMNQVTFGNMGICRNDGSLMMNMSAGASMNLGNALSGNTSDNSSPNFRMISSQRLGHTFFGNAPYTGPGFASSEGLVERGRSRRAENSGSQVDSKKQYQLDLEKIVSGEDTRTTLMIKNIPNKYTSKMLLAAIDENHKGTYDFLYLPIDFKNKCNVGYAFINMVSPSHIISFYQAFNGKKWEKFNSEKVASLAYARIQGKVALVAHFQNSSLMNEDKRCRPILFHFEGTEAGDQEPFPLNGMNICVRQQDGTVSAGVLAESPAKNSPSEKPEKSTLPENGSESW